MLTDNSNSLYNPPAPRKIEDNQSEYTSEYFVVGTDKKSIFRAGDDVSIYNESAYCFRGTISLITSKGIYLNVGSKRDKYCRLIDIDKIKAIESKE